MTPEIIQATAQTTPDLVSGKMDFSLLNYVSTMEIEQNGAIKFKYVAPGTVAAANVSEILVPKGSPIKSLADLKGKKIGSPQTTGAIGNLVFSSGQSVSSFLERTEIIGTGENVVVENNIRITLYRRGARKRCGCACRRDRS